MSELARIEARLESHARLGELVGALRSMAASRTREAQEALAGTTAYRETVAGAMAGVAPAPDANTDTDAGAGADTDAGPALLLVITSESGFVGGFNARVIDRAVALRTGAETLFLVGRRGQMLARERHVTADIALPMTARAGGVTRLARRISARLADVSRARIVFARHRQGGAYDVLDRQILPPTPRGLPAPPPLPPLHHLPAATLLDRLAREYLFAEIAHALMESLVSENGARMLTMDAASHNIDDRLDRLRREERVARQEQTTSDMLDVIVGAEAVDRPQPADG